MGRLFVLALLIIIVIVSWSWLAEGGLARIQANAAALDNPVGDFFAAQKGKPVGYSLEAMTPTVPTVTSGGESISAGGESLTDTERSEYAQELGVPSPAQGAVTIETVSPERNAGREYVTIEAAATNAKPIDITGWTIASAATGRGMHIPQGVATYRMGQAQALADIMLAPGAQAVLTSGASPLGASFRTNECTGYLAQFQTFTPSLADSCPSPASLMPNTLSNLQTYGASCIDLVGSISPCSYYVSQFPADITPACRAFVTNALSYNGCLDQYQWQAGFAGAAWRVYLGANGGLWDPAHDVIRLEDSLGRTVDVTSY